MLCQLLLGSFWSCVSTYTSPAIINSLRSKYISIASALLSKVLQRLTIQLAGTKISGRILGGQWYVRAGRVFCFFPPRKKSEGRIHEPSYIIFLPLLYRYTYFVTPMVYIPAGTSPLFLMTSNRFFLFETLWTATWEWLETKLGSALQSPCACAPWGCAHLEEQLGHLPP